MLLVQVVFFASAIALGAWWVYPLLWVLPYFTVWRVINRLRSVAEHGGLRADSDRRVTTHSVHQHRLARFFLVPYNIGFHLAHHVDAGVPFRRLPEYHRHLRAAGYVTDAYEFPTYRALWAAIQTGN
jgi:fatty acid desaturase